MAAALTSVYRIEAPRIKVLSNAAFFTNVIGNARESSNTEDPISLGFLSNISLKKGIVEFFDVLRVLAQSGVAYRARIAGPIEPNIQDVFSRLLGSSINTAYVGPVYGDSKEQFYKQLDIFLFPTKYVNEAEPLVIHEAIRSGVLVISCNRGSIPEILANGAGFLCTSEHFVDTAVTCIREFSANRVSLQRVQGLVLAQASYLQDTAAACLASLLDDISFSAFM